MAGFISYSTTKAKKNFFAGKFICFAGTIAVIKIKGLYSFQFTTIETTDLNKSLQIMIRFIEGHHIRLQHFYMILHVKCETLNPKPDVAL